MFESIVAGVIFGGLGLLVWRGMIDIMIGLDEYRKIRKG